jgi:ppGpp synthetase/RelA/SpoT-type nucleotidyltranferase
VIVGQRLKRFDRILIKLRRLSVRLSQVEDIAGCRAVLVDPVEVARVAQRIHRKWNVVDESDYRIAGKDITGYRCLHLIVRRQERLVEVQLRTTGQHYWADQVERTSSLTGLNLKDGDGPTEMLEYFRVASDITALQEAGRVVPQELQDELANLRTQVAPFFRPAPAQPVPGDR